MTIIMIIKATAKKVVMAHFVPYFIVVVSHTEIPGTISKLIRL